MIIHSFYVFIRFKREKSNWSILYCQTFLIFWLLLFVLRSSLICFMTEGLGRGDDGRNGDDGEEWAGGSSLNTAIEWVIIRESESETNDKKSENSQCLFDWQLWVSIAISDKSISFILLKDKKPYVTFRCCDDTNSTCIFKTNPNPTIIFLCTEKQTPADCALYLAIICSQSDSKLYERCR